eukprot:5964761-Amphidinium_carterae.1
MFDTHTVEVPEPVLLQDVVRPDNCKIYTQDEKWPLASLTICCVTQSQLEHLRNNLPDMEMTDSQDADVDARAAEEEPIFEDENNRLETFPSEVEAVDMEVDMEVDEVEAVDMEVDMEVDEEPHRASTFAGELQGPSLPVQETEGAHGSTLPGVSSETKHDEFVDCLPETANIDSSCIRDFGAATLEVILKQEKVLQGLYSQLHAFGEGSEAHQALQGQIDVMHQMVGLYRRAMEKAWEYAPPPSYSGEAVP